MGEFSSQVSVVLIDIIETQHMRMINQLHYGDLSLYLKEREWVRADHQVQRSLGTRGMQPTPTRSYLHHHRLAQFLSVDYLNGGRLLRYAVYGQPHQACR